MKNYLLITTLLLLGSFQLKAQSDLKNIAKKADNAIFTIITYDSNGDEVGKACGFFIDTTGRAIGRAHIFKSAKKAVAILDNGRKLKVKRLISIDRISNTALFKVKKNKKGYNFFADNYVTPIDNEEVLVLKNIEKKNSKVDLGKLRKIVKIEGFGELTELEQNINKENDGCPVINRNGKLIGVAADINLNNINYSLNYKGLSIRNQSLINFNGEKKLPGHKKTKFPPLRDFYTVYADILEENYEEALEEIKSHLNDQASAIVDEKDRRMVLFLKAFVERKLRLFNDAKSTYTKILEIKVDDEIAFLQRAGLKVKMGDLESAGKDLEESIASTKTNQALVKKLQGDLFVKLEDLKKADLLYVEAQNLGYGKYDLFRERSKIYVKKGVFNKANELINMAITANPYNSELYVLRGEIRAEMGKTEEAMEDFDKSEKMGNTNLASMKIIARTRLESKDNEGAIKTLEKAHTINSVDPDILLLRGKAFNEIQSYEQAKRNLDKLLSMDSYNAKAYYERGKTHLALSMMEESLTDFTKALQLNPDFVGAYLDRGVTLGLIGKYYEAIKDFENVIALDPKNEAGHHNLGLAKFQVKNRPAACKAWQKADELGHEDSKQFLEKYCSARSFSQRR